MTGSGKELVSVNSPPAKHAGGRPLGSGFYSEEVADEVCDRLVDGETLVHVCKYERSGALRERGTFPNHATVGDWADPAAANHHPEFTPRFARARLAQQQNWIESTVDISREPELGIEEVIEHSSKNGVTIRRARKDMIQHRALKIDTLRQAAARMNPQLWAERLQQAAPPALNQGGEPPRLIVQGGLPEGDRPPEAETPSEDKPGEE